MSTSGVHGERREALHGSCVGEQKCHSASLHDVHCSWRRTFDVHRSGGGCMMCIARGDVRSTCIDQAVDAWERISKTISCAELSTPFGTYVEGEGINREEGRSERGPRGSWQSWGKAYVAIQEFFAMASAVQCATRVVECVPPTRESTDVFSQQEEHKHRGACARRRLRHWPST